MSEAPAVRSFDVRHVQVARAVFAAIAAIMITFSGDHSAAVGLSVFGGFAIATALIHFLSVWLVYPAGRRWPSVVLGLLCVAAGMASSVAERTPIVFIVVVIAWAATTGLVELIAGIRNRRAGLTGARDEILVGAVSLLLAIGVAIVSPDYALEYTVAATGDSGLLTGITIAVGLFGGYAAIVAVFLGIAAASPRTAPTAPDASAEPVAPRGEA